MCRCSKDGLQASGSPTIANSQVIRLINRFFPCRSCAIVIDSELRGGFKTKKERETEAIVVSRMTLLSSLTFKIPTCVRYTFESPPRISLSPVTFQLAPKYSVSCALKKSVSPRQIQVRHQACPRHHRITFARNKDRDNFATEYQQIYRPLPMR